MKCNFRITLIPLAFLMFLFFFANGAAAENVEWEVLKTLDVAGVPVDLAISQDGGQLYVLTAEGDIVVYSTGSTPKHKIRVGNAFDRLKFGPQGDILILSSRTQKNVQIIRLDFVQDINVSGSPFKGLENSPVVVAVFTDFQ